MVWIDEIFQTHGGQNRSQLCYHSGLITTIINACEVYALPSLSPLHFSTVLEGISIFFLSLLSFIFLFLFSLLSCLPHFLSSFPASLLPFLPSSLPLPSAIYLFVCLFLLFSSMKDRWSLLFASAFVSAVISTAFPKALSFLPIRGTQEWRE